MCRFAIRQENFVLKFFLAETLNVAYGVVIHRGKVTKMIDLFEPIGRDWFATPNGVSIDKLKEIYIRLHGVPGVEFIFLDDNNVTNLDNLVSVKIHVSHLPLLSHDDSCWTVKADIAPGAPYTLRDYQIEAVSFAQQYRGTIMAHDLGLGKTATSLAAAKLPILVICPTVAVRVWEEEAALWKLTPQVLQGGYPRMSAINKNADLYIVTYGSSKWASCFFGGNVGSTAIHTLIADEAHIMQKKGLKWSKDFRKITREQAMLLTATPVRNGLKSLYPLLDAANPGAWGYQSDFRIRYCGAVQSDYGLVDGDPSNVKELRARLSVVLDRKTWADPRLKDLRPELHRHVIEVQTTGMDRAKMFQRASEYMAESARSGDGLKSGSHLVVATKLRTEVGKLKAPIVSKILPDLLKRHNRIVVWFWHNESLKIFKDLIEDIGCTIDTVVGTTSNSKRTKTMHEWKHGNIKKPRILLATIASFSAAVQLVTAEAEIFTEYDYAPLNIQQAEKRIHRHGSKFGNVYAYYVVCRKTFEDRMMKILLNKIYEIEDVFGEDLQTLQIKDIGE